MACCAQATEGLCCGLSTSVPAGVRVYSWGLQGWLGADDQATGFRVLAKCIIRIISSSSAGGSRHGAWRRRPRPQHRNQAYAGLRLRLGVVVFFRVKSHHKHTAYPLPPPVSATATEQAE